MAKIYELLTEPELLLRNVEFCPRDVLLATSIVFLSSLSLPISLAIIMPYKNLGIFLVQFLINPFLIFLVWVFTTGILHIFASLLLAKGNILKLFTCLGLSCLPLLLYTPGSIIISYLPSLYKTFIFLILGCFVSVWYLILQVYSVAGTYNMTKLRAFFVILLPILLISGLIFAGLLVISALLIISHIGL